MVSVFVFIYEKNEVRMVIVLIELIFIDGFKVILIIIIIYYELCFFIDLVKFVYIVKIIFVS